MEKQRSRGLGGREGDEYDLYGPGWLAFFFFIFLFRVLFTVEIKITSDGSDSEDSFYLPIVCRIPCNHRQFPSYVSFLYCLRLWVGGRNCSRSSLMVDIKHDACYNVLLESGPMGYSRLNVQIHGGYETGDR